MSNLNLVTGHRGIGHVTAEDHGSFQAAIFGTGSYVLDRGNKFAASVITNNQIRIADGDLLQQGRHTRLKEGTYIELSIENGEQARNRNDLIVCRYAKDSVTGVEESNLIVIKGPATAGTPVDPEYTEGDIINDHVYIADFPLYRIKIVGLTIEGVVPLFEMASLLADGAVTSRKIANEAVSKTYPATISSDNWTGETAPYINTVPVVGLLATDTPFVDMIASDDFETAEAQIAAYGTIYRMVATTDELTVYATDIPDVDIPVQIKAVRK